MLRSLPARDVGVLAGLGALTGLRTTGALLPLAVSGHGRGRIGGRAGRIVGWSRLPAALAVAAAGEGAVDKLPGVPPRTTSYVLGGRLAVATLVGAWYLAGSGRRCAPALLLAAPVGAAVGAVAGTRARQAARRRSRIAAGVLALAEDGLVAGTIVALKRGAVSAS